MPNVILASNFLGTTDNLFLPATVPAWLSKQTQFYKINAIALLNCRKSIVSIKKSFEYHLSSTTTSTGRHHVEMSNENLGLGLSFEVTS